MILFIYPKIPKSQIYKISQISFDFHEISKCKSKYHEKKIFFWKVKSFGKEKNGKKKSFPISK